MKKQKKILVPLALVLGSMVLAGCENPAAHKCGHVCPECGKCLDAACADPVCADKCLGHKHVCQHVCPECGKCTDETCKNKACAAKCAGHEEEEIVEFEVVYKDESGAEISKTTVEQGDKLTKPEDPTSAGKVFYGWKNVKNGGQIWDYEDNTLNKVMDNVELVPCFIDAAANKNTIEAELSPVIWGMNGVTYSGGQSGQGMIYRDTTNAYSCSCEVEPFEYHKGTEGNELGPHPTDPSKTKTQTICGAFFHFDYVKGNKLVYEISVEDDVANVPIFGAFSAEYGLLNKDDLYETFDYNDYKIQIDNGDPINYGRITIHNIVDKDFLKFQDFYLGDITLTKGNHQITVLVDNDNTLNGTIASTAPCFDCLKIFSDKAITCTNYDLLLLTKTN